MRLVQPYKHLNRLLEKESFEPRVSWALRMAISAMAPLIWGIYAGKLVEAGWIALAAECICWIELKGDFQQRLNLLAGGSLLAIIFAVLGSISGGDLWMSVLLIAVVGFVTSILKSIGDRGAGLALCVYSLFIFCNAYPVQDVAGLEERFLLVLIGGAWNAVAAIVASIFTPAQEPYRRTIAIILKSIAELTTTLSKGWNGQLPRSNEHDIYLKEKEIRAALDASLEVFAKTAQETDSDEGHQYTLAHVRKATSIVGAQMLTIGEELSAIRIKNLDSNIQIKVFTLLRATEQLLDRMAAYSISLDVGEELILKSRINRLFKLSELLKELLLTTDIPEQKGLLRVVQLTERNTRIIQSAFNNLHELVNERSMVRAYPFMKTFYILHPKYIWGYARLLFNMNTFTAKYAIRSAIAAAIAMFIYKFWEVSYGYWIVFTLLIVSQTYFGATLKKSADRVIGTVAGVIAAGIFLKIPTGLYLQEALLFLTFIPMIIFMRRKYSWSVFFITLNLVLLFNINRDMSNTVMLSRVLSTFAGAALAVISGFALLPTWDKKLLPKHLAAAIKNNYDYFYATFYDHDININWTKFKRSAESGNSNAFDSLTRYMQEPSFKKRPYAIFYYIITHNIRITRELNNFRLELDNTDYTTDEETIQSNNACIAECNEWFNKNVALLKTINPEIELQNTGQEIIPVQFQFTDQQEVYLQKLLIELKSMYTDLEILSQKLHRIMQL